MTSGCWAAGAATTFPSVVFSPTETGRPSSFISPNVWPARRPAGRGGRPSTAAAGRRGRFPGPRPSSRKGLLFRWSSTSVPAAAGRTAVPAGAATARPSLEADALVPAAAGQVLVLPVHPDHRGGGRPAGDRPGRGRGQPAFQRFRGQGPGGCLLSNVFKTTSGRMRDTKAASPDGSPAADIPGDRNTGPTRQSAGRTAGVSRLVRPVSRRHREHQPGERRKSPSDLGGETRTHANGSRAARKS